MKVSTINLLSGSMNLDKDPLIIDPKTEYHYARNFRNNNSSEGSDGVGGNVRGNKLIEFTQPEGVNTVLGSVPYVKNNSTIIFTYNSLGNHQIRLLKDEEITVLVQGSFLNFNPNYAVSSKINGDELVWTDNYNTERLLNLEMLINYHNYIYGAYNYPQIVTPNPAYQNILYLFEYGIRDLPNAFNQSSYQNVIIDSSDIRCVFFNGKAYYIYLGLSGIEYVEIGNIKKSYREITDRMMKFVAEPPRRNINATYETDSSVTNNFLSTNMYRFAYRYIYMDERQSVWSFQTPVSRNYTELQNGILTETNELNAIKLGFYVDRSDVARVEIGAVRNDSSDVMIIKSVELYKENYDIAEYDNFTDINFYGLEIEFSYFYDNEYYPTESALDFNRLYDYVPQKSKLVEVADNRVLFGDCTNGFNPISTDVELEVVDSPVFITDDTVSGNIYDTAETNEGSDLSVYPLWLSKSNIIRYMYIEGNVKGGIFSCDVSFTANGTTATKSFNITHPTSKPMPEFFRYVSQTIDAWVKKKCVDILNKSVNNMKNDMNTIYHDFGVNFTSSFFSTDVALLDDTSTIIYIKDGYVREKVWNWMFGTYTYKFHNFTISVANKSYSKSTTSNGIKTLKSNSKYDLGIKYLNDNYEETGFIKCGSVFTGLINNDSIIESSGAITFYSKKIKMSINHLVPDGATMFIPCISRNLGMSDYVQFLSLAAVSASGALSFELDISSGIIYTKGLNDKYNCEVWEFQQGDRIRDIGRMSGTDFIYSNTFDIDILSQDASSKKIKIPTATACGDTVGTKQDDIISGYVLEIYRPRKGVNESNDVYTEVSHVYAVKKDKHHSGDIQGQNSSNPAIIVIDYGDTYIVNSGTYNGGSSSWTYRVMERENQSDYFYSLMKTFGRPAVIVKNEQKRYANLIRFGGMKSTSNKVNYMARFDYDNYVYLPEHNGSINGMVRNGEVLSVYQDKANTSFYINQAVVKQTEGTNLYAVSDKFLNNMRESVYHYGTINPESVVKVNGYSYFFDAINGCFCRDADNGTYSISQYGINSFTKLLGKAVLQNGIKVYGAYDEYNQEVVWSFNWENEYGYGVAFVENGNQWKSFWDYYLLAGSTKHFVSLGTNVNKLVSFVLGNTYIHDSNNLYNTLYDRVVNTEISAICNENILNNKVFDYITIESNDEWKSDVDGDISVDGGQMKSMIPILKKKEGNYVANFGRDTITPMAGTSIFKYVNGRRLRGKVLTCKLRNNSTEKVNIFSVIINGTISNKL